MRYVKWGLGVILAIIVFGFLHYTLPQHDIVRIVSSENRRIDFGENSIFWAAPDSGNATAANRDVFFINTVKPNGKPMVYRNEDTGWGWPPYFKFDTSNLQAQANDLTSTSANPQWVSVTHYGWRNELLSIFPNAVGVKAVAGPDDTSFPWVNTVILLFLLVLVLLIWRMIAQFRERTIDPLLEDVDDAWDDSRTAARGKWRRFKGWLGTWKGKPRN
ncbi:hypothetical protein AQS8620_02766 [Aquimixticola soesokkakensis]|uniref:DUF1523 domain-containing protein n=1 Tax=Aquimixticola soesokkakensis TaxID=1519096 RepID=A0A1Y5TCH2_9RHOB|nr:DUF1523 family protein [Aquimixticola soesokkakensis]SLN60953.1 hypothetical protein AQS8620_02766 [Aquimixticola soesokkakensis]